MIGVDSDQGIPKPPAPKPKNGAWSISKKTFTFPKMLWSDFEQECKSRGLSSTGVVRDLMMCFLKANKEDLPDDYEEKIQEEIDKGFEQVAKIKERHKKAHPTAEKIKKKREAKKTIKPVSPTYEAILSDDPYHGWEEFDNKIKNKELK